MVIWLLFEHPLSPYTLEGVPPLPLSPSLTYCRPLSRLDKAKASFALCSLLHRLSQGREKKESCRNRQLSLGFSKAGCRKMGDVRWMMLEGRRVM